MILSCAIIDNDSFNLNILEYYINKTEGVKLISKSSKMADGIEIINTSLPDIVFMDIVGIENFILDDIFKEGIIYVFVTKYPKDYIFDLLPAYTKNSGFLAKPVSFILFTKEMDRVKEICGQQY